MMKIKSIVAHLQGLRVTRIAAIYAAVAWALLQVADVMFPIIGLSENAITVVLVLALTGFPLSLVMTWVFDHTSDGQPKDPDAPADLESQLPRLTPTRLVAVLASTSLFLSVGYLYVERLSESEEEAPRTPPTFLQDPARRPSIAVLPFVNLSEVADMGHFGDGLAEEILNLLAKLDELSVAARTSSFYFKDKNLDISEIADYLGVRYVLEGSVRHSGDQIRVTAQLIDASNGFHLWSETYDRDPSNIFRLQDDIGKKVVDNLQLLLSVESEKLFAREMEIDPDAYDYYLRGRDYLRRPGDTRALVNAEAMFDKAISMSPSYADALAGLCDTLLQQYSAHFEKARFNAAEDACRRAQALDTQSPAVHIALGNLYRESGQFALAAREFNLALSLKTNSVEALVGLADTLIDQEKYDLAESTLVQAIKLEPNNWSASMTMGAFLVNAGRVDESIRYFERVHELLPDSNTAATNLGTAYFLLGQFNEAAAQWKEALAGQPTNTLYSNLGSSYFFLGQYDEAAAMYRKALQLAPENFEGWGNLADAYRVSSTQADLAPKSYERAINLVEQHLKINPSDAVAIAALGHYLAVTGEQEDALAKIDLAQKLAQKEMYVYYFSATALCALDKRGLALDAIRKALALGYPTHLVKADAGLSCLASLPEYVAILDGDI